jgi:DHA2 family multidrug resistance protein-like MFS transporter
MQGRAQSGTTCPAFAVTAVLAAMALVVTDASLVNVGLPTIAIALKIAPSKAVYIVSAYQLSLLMFLLPAAAIGEAAGHRKVFAAGIVIFLLAALVSASASSLAILIAARFVQGIGGAAVMALGVALLRQSLSDARLGAAIAWNALTVALCSAAGPALGAIILGSASWHALFLVHLPLGVVALSFCGALPASERSRPWPDFISILLSCSSLGALVVAAAQIASQPGDAAALFILSSSAFALLVLRERSRTFPLIPFDLLGLESFRLSFLASICCFVAQTMGMLSLPFYLQQSVGLTPTATGLYMTAWPIAVGLAGLLAGNLANRLPTAALMASGAFSLALGLGAIALIQQAHGLLIASIFLCGLGFGFFQVPNNRNLFLSAPAERSGAAGGLQGTARLTGQALGAMLVSVVLGMTVTTPKLAFAVGAGFAIIAGAISFWHVKVQMRRFVSSELLDPVSI